MMVMTSYHVMAMDVDIPYCGLRFRGLTLTRCPRISPLLRKTRSFSVKLKNQNLGTRSRTGSVDTQSTIFESKKKREMGWSETVRNAEKLVEKAMNGNDASHDAAHVWRVRDLALSLAQDEGLSSNPHSMQIVELAALLHDIGDYKYVRDPSEEKIVEKFLEAEGMEEEKKNKILGIIKGMGFKEEVAGHGVGELSIEFGIVQDADRLDAIGAIGIARCFTFGGSRNRVLHDPNIKPRSDLSKEQYMKKDEQTTINHFHEKLLKLKDMMKTKAGRSRAEKRHKFMEEYLKEFYEEWDGKA
ncbi:hypothetical protein F8388_024254 [Cannabis sativa]|uniref:HD/PDEase domain-containing protein n=1 Tax=Cannabis sativa TaxID=3483 RepID=A0A7J6GXG6_CANSA|nr:hypothetical protein G4B88_027825 [Cannabis sativa]KAF4353685.1 hypothetical protein F8388_024254 [Cannabis sativa]KAF4387627.1 hypothetical protein G4B88_003954 [Cannabis sativa]